MSDFMSDMVKQERLDKEERQKFENLIKELNEMKIHQKSIDWEEDLSGEFYDKHIEGNFSQVKSGLDVEKHRWYETSISVYKMYGHLIGTRQITGTFSESQGIDDCYQTLEFFEMEEIKEITYRKAIL